MPNALIALKMIVRVGVAGRKSCFRCEVLTSLRLEDRVLRFHLGAVPESPDFVPETPWRGLREPTVWVMQLIALPIGIVTTASVVLVWYWVAPPDGSILPASLVDFLLYFAAIVVVHELIHVAVHPGHGRTFQSILGFWPRTLLFYAHFDGELPRNRFVAILLMPFFCLSLLPIAVCALFGETPGWVVFVSGFNAFSACGDLFGAGLVLFQLPQTSVVRNQGYRTFWKYTQDEPDMPGTGSIE